jgi:hypothetical protein
VSSVGGEQGPQPSAGAADPGAQRRLADAEGAGGVGLRHVGDHAELDDLPVLGGQALQRVEHPVEPAPIVELGHDGVGVVAHRRGGPDPSGEALVAHRPAPLGAGLVAGHGQQPRPRGVGGEAHLGPAPPGGQEGRGQDVLCPGAGAGEPERVPPDSVGVAVEQRGEGGLRARPVTAAGGGPQLVVVGGWGAHARRPLSRAHGPE